MAFFFFLQLPSLSTHVLTAQLNVLFFFCGYRLHQPNASSPTFDSPLPHPSDSIRAATLQLSKLSFSTSLPAVGMSPHSFRTYGVDPGPTRSDPTTTPLPLRKDGGELNTQHDEDGGFIFPRAAHMGHESAIDSTSFRSSQSLNSSLLHEIPGSSTESDGGFGLESSIESLPQSQKLSGLSLLRPDSSSTSSFNPSLVAPHSPSGSSSSRSSSVSLVLPLGPSPLPILAANEIADTTPTATPMGTPRPLHSTPLPSLLQPQINPKQSHVHWRSPRSIARLLGPTSPSLPTSPQAHEQTPLLGGCRINDDGPNSTQAADQDLEIGSSGAIPTFLHKTKAFSSVFSLSAHRPEAFRLDIDHVKTKMRHEVLVNAPLYLMQAVNAVPAVMLGCLLNILDGVSCELFLFYLQGWARSLWYTTVL